MGLFDRFKDFVKGEEYEEDEDTQFYPDSDEKDNTDEMPAVVTPNRATTGVSSSTALEMKVCRPSKYDEGPEIASHLLSGKTVVLNLEDANRDTIIRLIDFLFGVTFAIEGNLKKVSSYTYVITPKNVEVDNEGKATVVKNEEANAEGNNGAGPRPLF